MLGILVSFSSPLCSDEMNESGEDRDEVVLGRCEGEAVRGCKRAEAGLAGNWLQSSGHNPEVKPIRGCVIVFNPLFMDRMRRY